MKVVIKIFILNPYHNSSAISHFTYKEMQIYQLMYEVLGYSWKVFK